MNTNSPVPLVRRFSPVPESASDSDEQQIQELFGFSSSATWDAIDKGYRSVVLAEAGAGKTFEMQARAMYVEEQGHPGFFIRIEDIEHDFRHSFEVGNAESFEQWLRSQNDAWFYLDSVDEARLENPTSFQKAIRRFSREIRTAQQRAHVCISSRPYAWRPKSDRQLIERFLPLPRPRTEPTGGDLDSSNTYEFQEALDVLLLQPLDENDIRQFARHRSVPEIDRLIRDLERKDLLALAGRPFDLEAILDMWASDRTLGGRSDLFDYTVRMRLSDSHNLDRALRKSLNVERALDGARRLAAAVVLTGEAGIRVPDSPPMRTGIDAEAVLSEWDPGDVQILLERGIFNDVIYGAVRFRTREVREFLAAGWFTELLKQAHSRHEIDSLFFREQYGHKFISPRLRAVMPWLMLDDQEVCRRALEVHPEIPMEGGDPARLPLPLRKKILSDVVHRLVRREDYRAAGDNNALARIAHPDLTDHTFELIDRYRDNDEALFFLGRLVWQGAMSRCVSPLVPVAADPTREIYTRIAATRAVTTCGTKEQRGALWDTLLTADNDFPRELLADLVRGADETAIPKLLQSIEKLTPHSDSGGTGLASALHDLVDRLPLPSNDGVHEPFEEFICGICCFVHRAPVFQPGSCDVSKKFSWLLALAMHAVERLVLARNDMVFDEHTMALLRTAPTARHWRVRGIDDRNSKLSELIAGWPELNDALFWYSATTTGTQPQVRSPKMRDLLRLQWSAHYWEFGPDSFARVLDWVRTRKFEDEQVLALSLAFSIYCQAKEPSEWLDRLRDSVRGDVGLSAKLDALVNPVLSEVDLRLRRESTDYQRKLEREARETAQQRSDWIAGLKADRHIVRNPSGLEPGQFSSDQYHLLEEVEGVDDRTNRSQGAAWRTLIDEFGDDVARAYRDAAVAYWRRFRPELRSEGGNTSLIPYSLVFAMAGLAIEADEVEDFPRHLSVSEVSLALRYIVFELNGFPSWLEPMYEAFPEEVLDAVLTELFWELDNPDTNKPMNYILHDLVFYAPWLHSALAKPLLSWIHSHHLPSHDALRYSLCILRGGGAQPSELATLAKTKAADCSTEYSASWYTLWVDVEPDTGVDAATTWLDGLGSDDGARAAQLFITILMGNRRDPRSGASLENLLTPTHLKSLYVLMHRHIRAAEDIDRSGGGVFSPGLRDDAQEAREQLFNLLSEISGKEAYVALTELIEEHPHPRFTPWMARRARQRAEQDGDLEPWTPRQVSEFAETLTRTPSTHRQLFDLTVARITDLKNWVERGNNSPYLTWQRAPDESEIRNLVAGWLSQQRTNLTTVSQEPELANSQRMDIWLQNEYVPSPVPIELKLLDKRWSGPQLCERLRNQLAGDYLREATGGCGLMLLVWKGCRPRRHWSIHGRRVGIAGLQEALKEHWCTISNSFPNVAAIEVVVIDLTRRGMRSSVVRDE